MYRNKRTGLLEQLLFGLTMMLFCAGLAGGQEVRISSGVVEGTSTTSNPQVRSFKGIPYAAPPVGNLRWQPPQPVKSWQGTRQAKSFGPRCTQAPIYSDMVFRDEVSEDCLYLNVWTPARSGKEHLPVMVWIYGGGFQAGSASEPRQDGENLAKKGVVVVSFNYRLGVFGFLSHPELTAESGHHASGNYGLLDQVEALRWVQKNIAAFGGNPRQVTIFGESAGSFSVSGLMASPLARGLFQRAIGESGAFFSAGEQVLAQRTLAESERLGTQFATMTGARSLAELRAKSADEILQAASKGRPFTFTPNVDGYMLPQDVYRIYAEGKQSHVPLLAGWNEDEIRGGVVLAKQRPTAQSFTAQARSRFGENADELLKLYPASSDEQALQSAAELAGDLFIGYSTWKWIEMHNAKGNSPVYRYSFDRDVPIAPGTKVNGIEATSKDIGARHAGEIEYVFGTLDWANVPWQPEDRRLSELMMSYWTNFARTGNPNGPGLPKWPGYDRPGNYQVMHLNAETHAAPDSRRARYLFLDAYTTKFRTK